MFQTILVPTDGSDQAVKAVAIGSDLAAVYRARVILLHVIAGDEVPEELAHFARIENLPKTKQTQRIEQLEATPHGPVALPGGKQAEVDRAAVMQHIAERILEDAKGVAKHHGVESARVLTDRGDPVECILEGAKREHADGIVMGSRGLSDLKGTVLGSVSHKVSSQASCTCITVS